MFRQMPRAALWFLGFLLFLALFRDIVANGRPLYCRINGEHYFPGLRTVWADDDLLYRQPVLDSLTRNRGWKKFQYEAVVFAPIPFSPGDLRERPVCESCPPGAPQPETTGVFRHWLGTDEAGHDVAAGLVSGARTALLSGFLAMMTALILGLSLGAIAGYFGDDKLKAPRGIWWSGVTGAIVGFVYAFIVREYVLKYGHCALEWWKSIGYMVAIFAVFLAIGALLSRLRYFATPVKIPADLLVMRASEVFHAIPGLVVLLAIAAMLGAQRNLWNMVCIIGALSWSGIALYVRGELLRIRSLEYIIAARALGLTEWQILWRHALPNAMRPVMIAFALGAAGAVLLEASLAFLGYSDPDLAGASWGSLLNSSRAHFSHWWLSVPAGLAICFLVVSLNSIGDALNKQQNSQQMT